MLKKEEIERSVTDWIFKEQGLICRHGTIYGPFCELIRGEVDCATCDLNTMLIKPVTRQYLTEYGPMCYNGVRCNTARCKEAINMTFAKINAEAERFMDGDNGPVVIPEMAEILTEAQNGFKEFVDYCKHDRGLIESEGGLTDREVAIEDVRIAAENLGCDLDDDTLDLITDKYTAWIATDGIQYI